MQIEPIHPARGERASDHQPASQPGLTTGTGRIGSAAPDYPAAAQWPRPGLRLDRPPGSGRAGPRGFGCGMSDHEVPRHEAPPPGAARDAIAALLAAGQSPESLVGHGATLFAALPAAGLALLLDGHPTGSGQAPSEPGIKALAQWLEDQAPDGVLPLDAPPAGAPFSGRLLAISLPRRPRDWLIWLRPDSAAPWGVADIAVATALRTAWLEAALRQAEALAADRQAAQSHQAFVMAELDHRLKNILANIQALLRHSRRRAAGGAIGTDAFVRDFEARLHAMATAHDLLHASRWEGARLRPLIAVELGPHAEAPGRGRVASGGPDLVLRPRAAMSLSLALHELTTNAAKHGALSVPDGTVALRWRRTRAGLLMRWEEHGGPPAPPPGRRGFGLTVIERSLAYELGGSSQLDFTSLGLRCTIRIPAEHLALPA